MSHPQPPQRQPTPAETINYAKALHNTALISLVAFPLIALLPPRKLDFYTFGLVGGTVFSANYLIRESTGRSISQHLTGASSSATIQSASVPVGQPSEEQEKLRQLRQDAFLAPREQHSLSAEIHRQRNEKDWVAERDEEVKDALDEGKGLGDMIADQIWEVWNWGKRKDDD